VRFGKDQAKRHGGWKYFKAELFLRKYMLKNQLTSLNTYIEQIIIRIIYQLLLPPSVRNYITMKINRKCLSKEEIRSIILKNQNE
jgi:hypothetical protein